MKRFYLSALVFALAFGGVSYYTMTVVSASSPAQSYVEAVGTSKAPEGTPDAQAKAMARRGAMVDLQRNLLRKLAGVQVDLGAAYSRLRGSISRVEALDGQWDGKVYTLRGRVQVGQEYVSGTGSAKGK